MFCDWVGNSRYGIRLVGVRRNGRGEWKQPTDVPQAVKDYLLMNKLTIHLEPTQAPEIDLTVELVENFEQAPSVLFGAMTDVYGPFDGDKWFEVFGDVLQHLGQAFALVDEGDNPAKIVRSVPGDEDANYNLTVTVEQ